jgi:hypothetical protein
MLRAYEYVLDNPGCTKSEAACATFSRYEAWPAVNRAVWAGLIICEWTRPNRAALYACGSDLRVAHGLADPEPAGAGAWTPGHP